MAPSASGRAFAFHRLPADADDAASQAGNRHYGVAFASKRSARTKPQRQTPITQSTP
jgi:hypothetical protein